MTALELTPDEEKLVIAYRATKTGFKKALDTIAKDLERYVEDIAYHVESYNEDVMHDIMETMEEFTKDTELNTLMTKYKKEFYIISMAIFELQNINRQMIHYKRRTGLNEEIQDNTQREENGTI